MKKSLFFIVLCCVANTRGMHKLERLAGKNRAKSLKAKEYVQDQYDPGHIVLIRRSQIDLESLSSTCKMEQCDGYIADLKNGECIVVQRKPGGGYESYQKSVCGKRTFFLDPKKDWFERIKWLHQLGQAQKKSPD